MSDINTRLEECFAAVFPKLTSDEIRRASVNSLPSWDSLATLTLFGLIEEEFGIKIDPADRDEYVSFELLAHHLRSHQLAQ